MESSSSSASDHGFTLGHYFETVRTTELTPLVGKVVRVVGLLVESLGPHARVGEGVRGHRRSGRCAAGRRVVLSEWAPAVGAARRYRWYPSGCATRVARWIRLGAGRQLGSSATVDAFGQPMDGKDPLRGAQKSSLYRGPVDPLLQPVGDRLAPVSASSARC